MSGTRTGGLKARDKNLATDPEFYRKLGAKGGSRLGVAKGFVLMSPEKRSAAGRKGGSASRRGPALIKPDQTRPSIFNFKFFKRSK